MFSVVFHIFLDDKARSIILQFVDLKSVLVQQRNKTIENDNQLDLNMRKNWTDNEKISYFENEFFANELI